MSWSGRCMGGNRLSFPVLPSGPIPANRLPERANWNGDQYAHGDFEEGSCEVPQEHLRFERHRVTPRIKICLSALARRAVLAVCMIFQGPS